MTMTTIDYCTFCNEFSGSGNCNFRRTFSHDELPSRILRESENFVVLPALGPLTEGHLLILPKEHYICLGSMPPELYPELKALKQEAFIVLSRTYDTPTFFEHGAATKTMRGGCCIEHAHLQVFPCGLDLLPVISRFFTGERIEYLEQLREYYQRKQPYLFYENIGGTMYVFPVSPVIPAQFMRQLIAKALGTPEKWDWRSFLNKEAIMRAFRNLSNWQSLLASPSGEVLSEAHFARERCFEAEGKEAT